MNCQKHQKSAAAWAALFAVLFVIACDGCGHAHARHWSSGGGYVQKAEETEKAVCSLWKKQAAYGLYAGFVVMHPCL